MRTMVDSTMCLMSFYPKAGQLDLRRHSREPIAPVPNQSTKPNQQASGRTYHGWPQRSEISPVVRRLGGSIRNRRLGEHGTMIAG
jgi:hypothetical protein